MQAIDITDFWINRPYIGSSNNFTILSDTWCSLNNCTVGNGKAYYYNSLVDKQQLKCIVINDTFYFDFSASPITDVIKQQIWILKHTKGVEYKIEFVCLWEMFKLPTIEELNKFAKIKQEVIVPVVEDSSINYTEALNFLRLSTGLGEVELCRSMGTSLSEYLDYITNFIHTLSNEDVVRYATILYYHHNLVVQPQVYNTAEDLYNDSLQILMEASDMDEATILPEPGEELGTYINSINRLFDEDQDINYEDVTRHATNVYNYYRSTQHEAPFMPEIEDLAGETTEAGQIDHPF